MDQGHGIFHQVICFLCTRPNSQAGVLGSAPRGCSRSDLAIGKVTSLTDWAQLSVSSGADMGEQSESDENPSRGLYSTAGVWGVLAGSLCLPKDHPEGRQPEGRNLAERRKGHHRYPSLFW